MINRLRLAVLRLVIPLRPRPLARLRTRTFPVPELPRHQRQPVHHRTKQLHLNRVMRPVDRGDRERVRGQMIHPHPEVPPREPVSPYVVESDPVADEVGTDCLPELFDELKEAADSPRPTADASSHATSSARISG